MLVQPALPTAKSFSVTPVGEPLSGEEQELLNEEALYDAAFASLELCQGSGEPACRIVAAAQVDGKVSPTLTWDQVDSIMADSEKGRRLAAGVLRSDEQAETDLLLEDLFEEPLSWFDVSERQDLFDQVVDSE